jgi:ribulose-bisphosphate carboxylase small chain
MASMTVAALGAPAVAALSASSSTTSTSARAQLVAPALKTRIAPTLQSKTVSNGSRVNAFNVVNPLHNIKFETLSFLPPLTDAEIEKQVDYLLKNGWIPAIEFDNNGVVSQSIRIPGYYDGRYWVMWKLPLFGAKESSSVLGEVLNCQKDYPEAFIRVIGFDNVRQVQVVSFLVKKPKSWKA